MTPPLPWYESRAFTRAAVGFLAGFLLFAAWQGIIQRDNDFLDHYQKGRAALEGQPLSGPHYLPGRQVVNALLATLPYRLSRAVTFLLAIAALLAVLRDWRRLADAHNPITPTRATAVSLLAVLGAFHYLWRDLDDCGLQILLLFFLTRAAMAITRGQPGRAGAWLGFAAAYKTPTLLMLGLLTYKRRWREAGWTLVWIVVCNVVLPAALFGPERTVNAWRNVAAVQSAFGQGGDPSLNPIEPAKHQNQSLLLTLPRLVQAYPPGHPLFMAAAPDTPTRPHPLFIQIAALSPASTRIVVTAVLLLLALVVAWRLRHPWRIPSADPRFAPEWAAVTAMVALLSPLCWMHHLVLLLPAMLLVLRTHLEGRPPAWRTAIVGYGAVVMWLLVYDLLPRPVWMLVLANGFHTWAAVGIVVLVLTLPGASSAARRNYLPGSVVKGGEGVRPAEAVT